MKLKDFNIRLDNDIKEKAELIYNQLGIDLSTAIDIFLRKSIDIGGFPFDIKVDELNKETLLALLESENITYDDNIEAYDVKDALKELKR